MAREVQRVQLDASVARPEGYLERRRRAPVVGTRAARRNLFSRRVRTSRCSVRNRRERHREVARVFRRDVHEDVRAARRGHAPRKMRIATPRCEAPNSVAALPFEASVAPGAGLAPIRRTARVQAPKAPRSGARRGPASPIDGSAAADRNQVEFSRERPRSRHRSRASTRSRAAAFARAMFFGERLGHHRSHDRRHDDPGRVASSRTHRVSAAIARNRMRRMPAVRQRNRQAELDRARRPVAVDRGQILLVGQVIARQDQCRARRKRHPRGRAEQQGRAERLCSMSSA